MITIGRFLYDCSLLEEPFYWDGSPRPAFDELQPWEQQSWESDPDLSETRAYEDFLRTNENGLDFSHRNQAADTSTNEITSRS